ncbi:MAG: Uma2 family endonuclease [Cyanobacteria bacterium P01_H01_bin.121]
MELEVKSDLRHEYIDGAIVPMTGGTPEHNKIAGNLFFALMLALKGKPYDIFIADQRLWIPERSLYTYPDVLVTQRPLVLQTGRNDTVMNPCLIAEVLSKSTQSYDRGEKFAAYRTMPSFQEYLLVDQYSVHVEHYRKTEPNQWLFSEHNDLNQMLQLLVIDVSIALADLYDGVLPNATLPDLSNA